MECEEREPSTCQAAGRTRSDCGALLLASRFFLSIPLKGGGGQYALTGGGQRRLRHAELP